MIAVDTNILVYAHRADSEFFDEANKILRKLADGHEPWTIPWSCLYEFLCVVTNPRFLAKPSTLEEALYQIDLWLESATQPITEGDDHWMKMKEILSQAKMIGPRVYDARIAVVAMTHNIRELYSCDRDFSRIPSLKTRNPLVKKSK